VNITVWAAFQAASLSLSALAGSPGLSHRHTPIEGRIIAYRPYDRVIQFSSFVINEEVFLFEISSSRGGSLIVKVRYRHVGESEITSRILEQAPAIKLQLRREPSCDETYAQFVSSAPALRDQSGETLASGVSFVEKFHGSKPPNDLELECYMLEQAIFESWRGDGEVRQLVAHDVRVRPVRKAAVHGSTDPSDAHSFAHNYFGGLELPDRSTLQSRGDSRTGMVYEFPLNRPSTV
jgi:hypothetical protein